ncbi:hypothetical protein GOP47_0002776 [Adiantum capillus-veneris]|uniref:Ycf49-like protein n=1 Tax=Adiantum capillus-veneris TaxID=13818 RepID=A0A9D4ZPG1_ADICA|nr:hypothetical protein GOP47_0002776 [Adiantum capillus-veneris]
MVTVVVSANAIPLHIVFSRVSAAADSTVRFSSSRALLKPSSLAGVACSSCTTSEHNAPVSPLSLLVPMAAACLLNGAGASAADADSAKILVEGLLSQEPANALSLPTWTIHVASVVEWIVAMGLVWRFGDNPKNAAWKGLTWGMVPLLGGAMCACTWHFFYNAESLEILVLKVHLAEWNQLDVRLPITKATCLSRGMVRSRDSMWGKDSTARDFGGKDEKLVKD